MEDWNSVRYFILKTGNRIVEEKKTFIFSSNYLSINSFHSNFKKKRIFIKSYNSIPKFTSKPKPLRNRKLIDETLTGQY